MDLTRLIQVGQRERTCPLLIPGPASPLQLHAAQHLSPVVCRTFLSALRFCWSAIVKRYVEDFREAEVRRIASLSHSLCVSQRCLATRLVCAPDGVVCRTFMLSSLCLLFELKSVVLGHKAFFLHVKGETLCIRNSRVAFRGVRSHDEFNRVAMGVGSQRSRCRAI